MEKAARILSDQWILSAAALAAFLLLYVVAIDQGFLLSLAPGAGPFDLNFFHEAFHDARHAAGLPCH